MICPYCAENVPSDVKRHQECKRNKDTDFPLYYLDFHSKDDEREPILLSVVGFGLHGKTVYLCSLFDFLDNGLTSIWHGFYNWVLDQESLTPLYMIREELRTGKLPERTTPVFPRPGIFRLTKMPHLDKASKMPPLNDTTVLIYDPPGEAFENEKSIVDYASFVKRSSCVLFLIDITKLGNSVADGMAKLLETYMLGMRRMEAETKTQHLIVVYTKSDKMKSSVPKFRRFLQENTKLDNYISEPIPDSLSNPEKHLRNMVQISDLLEDFTETELRARKFLHMANDSFKSVSYTVISSLGASPEEDKNGKRMTVEISPKCVVDPLLFVLAKSLSQEKEAPSPIPESVVQQNDGYLRVGGTKILWGILGVLVLLLLLLLFWLVTPSAPLAHFASTTSSINSSSRTNLSTVVRTWPKKKVAELPKTTVEVPIAVNLLAEPSDDGYVILSLPEATKVNLLEEKKDSDGKTWIRVSVKDQTCDIGRISCDPSESCEPSIPVTIAEYTGWVSVYRVDEVTKNDIKVLEIPDDSTKPAIVTINANLRDKPGVDIGIPILILRKGAEVILTKDEYRRGETGLWKKVRIKNQICCVCPPQDQENGSKVYSVLVADVVGWIDKNLLDL